MTGSNVLTDLLGTVAVGDIGLAGLVVIAVLMLLTGRLVPKSTLDNERENTATWRAAAEVQREVNSELKLSVSELLALARASDHALREIQALGAASMRAKEVSD